MSSTHPNLSPRPNRARPPRSNARSTGPASDAELIRITFVLRRRPGATELPNHAHWIATPPGRRRFCSRAEFAQTHGASPDDLDAVVAFAREHGMTVLESSAGGRFVTVLASVAAANQAFGIALQNYEAPDEAYRGFEGAPLVPSGLDPIVRGVLGLDTRRIGRHSMGNGTGPAGASPRTPIEIGNLYYFPQVNGDIPNVKSAAGQTIGILEFGGGYSASDATSYWRSLNVSPLPELVSDPPTMPYEGNPQLPSNRDVEVALDAQVAGAVAPGCRIVLYFGTGFSGAPTVPDEQGWYTTLARAIHDDRNRPNVISVSWSATEADWGPANIVLMTSLFRDAAALGVTILASSGDTGSSGYNPSDPRADRFAHVHYPASDPWVTGCGGTIVKTVDQSTWEEAWNDAAYQGGATGGGVSSTFTDGADYPWQKDIRIDGQPAQGRGVPDVAGNASPYSGYDINVYGQKTSVLNASNSRVPATPAGTSAVAPLYAGLIAMLNANLFPTGLTNAASVGFLNPTLYQWGVAQQAQGTGNGIFQDIATGNNYFNGASPFYNSTSGWDACTGWGSINGTGLFDALVLGMVGNNPGCLSSIMGVLRSIVGS
jgi:kumamolisin